MQGGKLQKVPEGWATSSGYGFCKEAPFSGREKIRTGKSPATKAGENAVTTDGGDVDLPGKLNTFLESVHMNCENLVKKLGQAKFDENAKLIEYLENLGNSLSVPLKEVEGKFED